jgi:ribonucleotide monophosphatase NagD (HAD superfamily)
MTTALVTTGVTDATAAATAGDDDPDCRPDLILESLAELSDVLGGE